MFSFSGQKHHLLASFQGLLCQGRNVQFLNRPRTWMTTFSRKYVWWYMPILGCHLYNPDLIILHHIAIPFQ